MPESDLKEVLAALDVVVMERTGADTFYLHGSAPPWLRRVNTRWKGEREVLASRTFPFLDHFLADAEAFWASGSPGRLGSGLASEPSADGRELHFEAWAVTTDAGRYLLIELRRDAEALQAMLQRAREGLLEHERLERTQRALERAHDELRQATQQAEAAAAARASMLSTISHEVRTPVHAILGLTGLMLDSPLPAGQARFLSLIRSSSETLLAVLEDILDASRLGDGGLALEARVFDVRHVVDEALDVVALRAAERRIDLNCQVDLAVPAAVVGDAARLRQVLINLVSNAVKFTTGGDVLVVAEAHDRDDGHVELHFAVRDEGPGIAGAQLDVLLAAAAEPGGGAWSGRRGLGLAICKTLVERMGGRLWADTRQGRGTTFHFTALLTVAQGATAPHLEVHQPLLDGRTVWILGGSPATQQLLINQTRFWGMAPKATASAAELDGWLAAGRPDVVLADRARLEPEVAERLGGVPVIELVTLVEAAEAAARPVAGLLTKPVKCARLHALLVAQLGSAASPLAT